MAIVASETTVLRELAARPAAFSLLAGDPLILQANLSDYHWRGLILPTRMD